MITIPERTITRSESYDKCEVTNNLTTHKPFRGICCCRDIIPRLQISIATGCKLSATGKLPLVLSSTGIFRYFLGRIAEITENEKSDLRNQLQKEITSR